MIFAGSSFRFGHRAEGDPSFERSASRPEWCPLVERTSSTQIRQLLRAGEVERGAALLGRPAGDRGNRGGRRRSWRHLGFPTANLAVPENLLVPAFGIYAGAAGDHRAAISIGVNPHYGGRERRVEAFLLDFADDLYGQRLIVELWRYSPGRTRIRQRSRAHRPDRADVEAARSAERPRTAVRPV